MENQITIYVNQGNGEQTHEMNDDEEKVTMEVDVTEEDEKLVIQPWVPQFFPAIESLLFDLAQFDLANLDINDVLDICCALPRTQQVHFFTYVEHSIPPSGGTYPLVPTQTCTKYHGACVGTMAVLDEVGEASRSCTNISKTGWTRLT